MGAEILLKQRGTLWVRGRGSLAQIFSLKSATRG